MDAKSKHECFTQKDRELILGLLIGMQMLAHLWKSNLMKSHPETIHTECRKAEKARATKPSL